MGKKKEETRSYGMSDGALVELTDETILFGTRDTTELTPQGVTSARLDALGDNRDDFNAMEDDEEWSGLVSEKTEEKNAAAALCQTKVHNIRRMAANVFGEGTAKFRRFRFEGINDLLEDKRPKAYRRVLRRATDALALLTAEGLTTTLLTEFEDAIQDYDDKLEAVEDTVADRDNATEARIILGNLIYDEVVKICNTGKDYWFDKSEAKYNDYIIYDSTAVLVPPAGVQHFSLNAGSFASLISGPGPIVFGHAYVKKTGGAGSVLVIYYGLSAAQPYSGSGGLVLNNNRAISITPTSPGATQPYLLVQNISGINADLDFGVID
jgi:hypothetical protein